jgi:hypothetical protein
MIERRYSLCFAYEAQPGAFVLLKSRREKLQGHVAIQLGISCLIHLTHTPFANLGGNLKMSY